MRDARKQIVIALISKLGEKLPAVSAYTIVPEKEYSYPYLYVSDIFQNDESNKTTKEYDYELLVQVVHKGLTDKTVLYDNMNSVVSIIENRKDLTLTDDFVCEYLQLISTSEAEIQTDTGIEYIGLIRFRILVSDIS